MAKHHVCGFFEEEREEWEPCVLEANVPSEADKTRHTAALGHPSICS